jgi:hypothetical protein
MEFRGLVECLLTCLNEKKGELVDSGFAPRKQGSYFFPISV